MPWMLEVLRDEEEYFERQIALLPIPELAPTPDPAEASQLPQLTHEEREARQRMKCCASRKVTRANRVKSIQIEKERALLREEFWDKKSEQKKTHILEGIAAKNAAIKRATEGKTRGSKLRTILFPLTPHPTFQPLFVPYDPRGVKVGSFLDNFPHTWKTLSLAILASLSSPPCPLCSHNSPRRPSCQQLDLLAVRPHDKVYKKIWRRHFGVDDCLLVSLSFLFFQECQILSRSSSHKRANALWRSSHWAAGQPLLLKSRPNPLHSLKLLSIAHETNRSAPLKSGNGPWWLPTFTSFYPQDMIKRLNVENPGNVIKGQAQFSM